MINYKSGLESKTWVENGAKKKAVKTLLSDGFVIPSTNVRLSPNDFAVIRKHLPIPQLVETIGDATFSVYQAKEINGSWTDLLLKRIVQEARKSYSDVYGDIALLDSYDHKSAVYLIQISYFTPTKSGIPLPSEEWFSLRFIPAEGLPNLIEDLTFYQARYVGQNIPVWSLIQSLLPGKQSHPRNFNAISRFCAIRPYAADPKKQAIFEDNVLLHKNPLGNRFAALSFALINKEFLSHPETSASYLTSQMHVHMTDKILSVPAMSAERKMAFTPAYVTLGMSSASEISLDRNNPQVFSYPGYFLNLRELVGCFQYLVEKELLSEKTLDHYFQPSYSFATVLKEPHMYHMRNIGRLLTIHGRIPNERLTGEELRSILNERVKDGPQLRIMKTADWNRSVSDIIEFAQNMYKPA